MDLKSEISQAATLFGIGEVRNFILAAKGLGNKNYFVSTDRGEYVIRILGTQSLDGLENEVSIEQQLSNAGVIAAKLIQTEQGNYFIDIEGQKFTCSERIAGEHPEVTPELANKMGAVLGKFSEAITSLPKEAPSWFLKENALEEAGKLPTDEFATSIAKRLNESLDLFEADLPTGFVHSDLHLGNLLLTPKGEIAIFDFEEIGKNVLIIDLATSAIALYDDERLPNGILLKQLIEGYETLRRLTAEEKQYFNKAVLYVSAAAAAWLYNQGHERYAKESMETGSKIITLESFSGTKVP